MHRRLNLYQSTIYQHVFLRPPGHHAVLVCPSNHTDIRCSRVAYQIVIDTVFYGRMTQQTCNPGNVKSYNHLPCVGGKKSSQKVHTYCDGQSACVVYSNPTWATEDPCPGIDKYFRVSFLALDCALQ